MIGKIYPLHHRGLIQISGTDRYQFLQGLITQDIFKLSQGFSIIYSAMLSAQGKFQHDFFLFNYNDHIFIDCEKSRADSLCQQLLKFKLRSKVDINCLQNWQVYASISNVNLPNTLTFADPRLPELGYRFYSSLSIESNDLSDFAQYDRWRITHGVPDGSRDIPIDSGIILECRFDELNAIDWHKGCYLGQELTSRCYYRGLIRKRLFPVKIKSGEFLDATITQNGKVVGKLRTHVAKDGIAMLKLESLSNNSHLFCGNSMLQITYPRWIRQKKSL